MTAGLLANAEAETSEVDRSGDEHEEPAEINRLLQERTAWHTAWVCLLFLHP